MATADATAQATAAAKSKSGAGPGMGARAWSALAPQRPALLIFAQAPNPAKGVAPRHRLLRASAQLALVATAWLGAACSQQNAAPAPPQTVLATVPRAAHASAPTVYSGDVQARFASTLSFRLDGKIVNRLAHLGERVRRGQRLASLDPDDAAARLKGAQAALAAAQERLTLARQQQERNSAQAQDDLVSRSEVEQSDANFNIARADVEQRRNDLALAQDQLQYTELVADHEGFITSENAEVGSVVKAGQQVFGLAWTGERDVVIDVPERRIREVSRGQAAQIALLSAPAQPLTAHVRDIAEAADPQSRTFRVKLALDKPEQARLGSSVQASLAASVPAANASAGAADQLVIPASALFHDGTATAVWLIEPHENKLSLRPVEVADYGADTVTLAAGLAAGERIVAQGVHAVHAGQVVTPVEPRAEGTHP